MLQFRVEELEGRLSRLEDQLRGMRGADCQQPPVGADGLCEAELPLEPDAADGALGASIGGRGDCGREGARLVVIEMLTSGYTREQIATYLRHTFAVEDPETLLAEAGPLAG